MKHRVWVLALLVISVSSSLSAAEPAPDLTQTRQKLVQAILSEGLDQQKLLDELAESGATSLSEALNSWSHDGVFLFTAADQSKVPVVLEEAEDGAGKHRALRVDDGKPLKDGQGTDLKFAATELPNAETDMRLRSAIQQAVDTLALSAPEPEARHSAALKLGNSLKPRYLPVLQNRLAKETNHQVRKGLEEAVALLQLAGPDAKTQVDAIKKLQSLQAIGSLENIRAVLRKTNCPPGVMLVGRSALHSIEEHIWWVNFFGTIFHGLSLGSILLVVALGLAITFGLMGIINMAHGEMIAVGAYACYVVQNLFASGFGFSITLPFSLFGKPFNFGLHLPGLNATGWFYESYFLFALPLSFIAAALAGLVHRAHRDSISVSAPAGITAGHLGPFLGNAAMLSNGFRRQQRAGQLPILAARPLHGPRCEVRLQPRVRDRLRGTDRRRHMVAAHQDISWTADSRRDAKPGHGGLPGSAHCAG